MTHIHRSAILPYSDEKMFALVNDVAAYPEFLKDCAGVDIHDASETEMLATLYLEKRGIKLQFTTKNILEAPKSIRMSLQDGPFDTLSGHWFFQHLEDNACKVILDIEFSLSKRLVSLASKKLFDSVSHNMVDSMIARARSLYG
jgi:ribosome-associated toxin RatA of RatAB toxin-antitoxin module